MKVIPTFIKILAVLVIFTAVVYGGYSLFRGRNAAVPALFSPMNGERLLMSMDGFTFMQSVNGNTSWRMIARSAELYENKEAHVQDMEIVFIGSDKDKKQATLLGEEGTMDTSSGNASIHRGIREVRIATSDGYLLTTDSLSWKAGERLVWTADPFKLLGKELYLEGTGISTNVDMHTIVVKKNVKAVLQE